MKYLVVLFFTLFTSSVFAQGKLLDANSPLLGTWEYQGNDVPKDFPLKLMETRIVRFKEGNNRSMFAISYMQSVNSYAGPSYFVAREDEKHIYGTLIKTVFIDLENKKFTIDYTYSAKDDELILSSGEKKLLFRRFNIKKK